MDIRLLKKMRRRRRLFRLGVLVGLFGAGMMLVYFVFLALDPSASIVYNGVPTTAFNEKLSAALIPGVVLVVFLGLLLLPDRAIDRTFVRRQHTLSTLSSWLR
ncbi:nitrate reductase gamma subunit [Rhodanobacter sp. TND4EL1]